MGNRHLRFLLLLVSLNVLFITFSHAEGLYAVDDVPVCILRPNIHFFEAYVRIPYYSGRPMYFLADAAGRNCHEGYCCAHVPRNVLQKGLSRAELVLIPRFGASPSEFNSFPATIYYATADSVDLTRIVYNFGKVPTYVVYAARGVGYVSIDENIPKSVAETADEVSGNVLFLNLDPVIRVHLRVEKDRVEIAHFVLSGSKDVNLLEPEVRFASCDLAVKDFAYTYFKRDGRYILSAQFRIYDGDSPVVIRGVTVRYGDRVISPQYSSDDMYYMFMTPYDPDTRELTIFASADGCSELQHVESVNPPPTGGFLLWVAVFLLGAAVTLYMLHRQGRI